MDFSSIDQRLFLSNRAMTLTPTKYTNIPNNKSLNKQINKGNQIRRNFASQKVLNYDLQDFDRVEETSADHYSNASTFVKNNLFRNYHQMWECRLHLFELP